MNMLSLMPSVACQAIMLEMPGRLTRPETAPTSVAASRSCLRRVACQARPSFATLPGGRSATLSRQIFLAGGAALTASLASTLLGKRFRGRRGSNSSRKTWVLGLRAEAAETSTMHSPFDGDAASPPELVAEAPELLPAEDASDEAEKPKLELTWANVDIVLDEVRPYLKADGGNCKIVDIDGTVVSLELEGACSSCSASSVTMKMGIEKTLMERIPEVTSVVSVSPEQEPLTAGAIEEVLDGIRPFLNVSGGTIEQHRLNDGSDGSTPEVVLMMKGPPLKSMAVRVEVVNRTKRRFPFVEDVIIVGEDGQPPKSA